MHRLSIVFFLATAPIVFSQETEDWPQFLGAHAAARATGASTLDFDMKRDLRYRVELPPGDSSPCVWKDQVFLTGQEGNKLVMFALDRKTGKEQWRHSVEAPKEMEFAHVDASLAVPTACTNGRRVFFYLPSYGLVARTLDGALAWEKHLPDPEAAFGIGSSPMLHGDLLFLLRDGCPDAAIYALDEDTGKEVWSVPRPAFFTSHTTPFIWKNRERTELIISSTGAVLSFEPGTGKELWRVDGLTPLVCTTPTASADRLYFAGWSTPGAAGVDRFLDGIEDPIELTKEEKDDPKLLFRRLDADSDGKVTRAELPRGRANDAYTFLDGNSDGGLALEEWVLLFQQPAIGKNLLIAIKPGGSGNVTETHVEWSARRGIPYVSSPLLYDEHVYLVKAGGVLNCFDAATGKSRFRSTRLDDRSEYYASPIGVDGHVIICSSAGNLFVLEAADEPRVVRTVDFGEQIHATPAFAFGSVYVRTRDALYAFGRDE